MEEFFNDIRDNLNLYYDKLVEVFPRLVLGLVVFVILYTVIGWVRRLVAGRLLVRMDDPLLAKFLGRILKFFLTLVAFMIALQIMGMVWIVTGLLAGASVSAIVVGFAFKDVGENFLAGIMLAFSRPFRVGDYVELSGQKGKVVALNLRDTQIKSFDGRDIYIPNAAIVKNPVVNYTIDGFLRKEFNIGLDYGSDVSTAIESILRTVSGVEGVLTESRAPSVVVQELASSSIVLTVYYWYDTLDPKINIGKIHNRVVDEVVENLSAEGYYLPGDVIEIKTYADKEIKSVVRQDAGESGGGQKVPLPVS